MQFSLRNKNLTFNHHRAVAKLKPGQQRKWLEKAALGDASPAGNDERIPWSVARLRSEIKQATQPGLPDKVPELNPAHVARTARSIARVLQVDADSLTPKKREQHLGQIATLRRLLDEAERKLRDD